MQCFSCLVLYIISNWIFVVVSTSTLSALSFSPFGQQLYLELTKHKDDALPSKEDPVILNAQNRGHICDEITGSGFFQLMGFVPIDVEDEMCSDPQHFEVFNQDCRSRRDSNFENTYQYRAFQLRQMWVGAGAVYRCKEYLFTCVLKNLLSHDVELFFVSKEYDTGLSNHPSAPGRFIFSEKFDFVILAEEPAIVPVDPNSNVELEYLRIRKHVLPADTDDIDPFCKLVSGKKRDRKNQHHRLCVAVSRSSSLKDKFTYPDPLLTSACEVKMVSFRTTDGVEESRGQLYYERMTRCYSMAEGVNGEKDFLYVSRGYRSTQVFVYRSVAPDGKIYLENLSTSVKIIDELNSFDFIED